MHAPGKSHLAPRTRPDVSSECEERARGARSYNARASEQVLDTAGGQIMFVIARQLDVLPGRASEGVYW